MELGGSRSLVVWLVLMLGIILLVLQIIDAKKIILSYKVLNTGDINYMNSCVKYPLIAQSVLLAIQISICLYLIVFSFLSMFKMSKLIYSLNIINLKMLCFMCGPFSLGFCILGFIYWDKVSYSCNTINYEDRELNIFISLTIIINFLISCAITLTWSFIDVFFLQIDSLLRKSTGSDYARKAFWYFASKSKRHQDLNFQQRIQNIEEEGSINQSNIRNNLPEENIEREGENQV